VGGGSVPGQTAPVTIPASMEPAPPPVAPPAPRPPVPLPLAPPALPPMPEPPPPATPPLPPAPAVPPVPPEPPPCLASDDDGASVEAAASVEMALVDLPQPLPANTERPARMQNGRITLWNRMPSRVAKVGARTEESISPKCADL
jgi:hypothetical protein